MIAQVKAEAVVNPGGIQATKHSIGACSMSFSHCALHEPGVQESRLASGLRLANGLNVGERAVPNFARIIRMILDSG